jgi:hypothetical protein
MHIYIYIYIYRWEREGGSLGQFSVTSQTCVCVFVCVKEKEFLPSIPPFPTSLPSPSRVRACLDVVGADGDVYIYILLYHYIYIYLYPYEYIQTNIFYLDVVGADG